MRVLSEPSRDEQFDNSNPPQSSFSHNSFQRIFLFSCIASLQSVSAIQRGATAFTVVCRHTRHMCVVCVDTHVCGTHCASERWKNRSTSSSHFIGNLTQVSLAQLILSDILSGQSVQELDGRVHKICHLETNEQTRQF